MWATEISAVQRDLLKASLDACLPAGRCYGALCAHTHHGGRGGIAIVCSLRSKPAKPDFSLAARSACGLAFESRLE